MSTENKNLAKKNKGLLN